jgi:hypothetical protein
MKILSQCDETIREIQDLTDKTEQIKVTTAYRVNWVSPYDGRPRSWPCGTYEEVRCKVTKLLNRGHHEEDIVVVFRFTNG